MSDVKLCIGIFNWIVVGAISFHSFPLSMYTMLYVKKGRRGISVHSSFRNDESKSVKGP